MPRCRREWEGYSERAGEGESGVQLCSIVVFAVWLALLLFLPDLRLRFRRSPLFLPVSWLSSPRKEIVRYGLDSERRERARELRLWLRFWFQSRIQLVAAQTRIAPCGQSEFESSAISLLSIAAIANSTIVLIEIPRNRRNP